MIDLKHFPTVFLIVGYPLYWLELYVFSPYQARTSIAAWGATLFLFFILLWRQFPGLVASFKKFQADFMAMDQGKKIYSVFGGALCLLILGVSFYAARLPPHLPQELDVINYHMMIPRQHLLLGSFDPLRWSSADLFLLPIDFALAPFWLATPLPNKWPQFFFLFGLLLVCWSLAGRFSGDHFLTKILVVFALLASHNIGIQAGTGMLGLVATYLFFAAWDSFFKGKVFLSAVETAFYFWSKPFIPLEGIFVILGLIFLYFSLRKLWGAEIRVGYVEGCMISPASFKECFLRLKSAVWIFIVISLVVTGPFVFKSLRYSGTPLYPFGAGTVMIGRAIDTNTLQWRSIIENSRRLVGVKDSYGSGRSALDFIKHFWVVAIPENGVNNRYDYPLGLIYLLCAGPFLYIFVRSLRQKQFLIFYLLPVIGWFSWWMTTQQTRFLYISVVLMVLSVVSVMAFHTRMFRGCVLLALALTSLSVFRAHAPDFRKSAWESVRREDKELLMMSKDMASGSPAVLKRHDVAFAEFPVAAVDSDYILVLKF